MATKHACCSRRQLRLMTAIPLRLDENWVLAPLCVRNADLKGLSPALGHHRQRVRSARSDARRSILWPVHRGAAIDLKLEASYRRLLPGPAHDLWRGVRDGLRPRAVVVVPVARR